MNDFTQFKKHFCLSTEISKGESGYPETKRNLNT